jgi:excisionase family DNA binding protein
MHLVPYEQIAVEAGVSVRTICRDVKRGKLRSYKVGGKALIDAGAAREYIADKAARRPGRAA